MWSLAGSEILDSSIEPNALAQAGVVAPLRIPQSPISPAAMRDGKSKENLSMVAERADDPGHHGLGQDTLQVTGDRPLDQGHAQVSDVRRFDDVTAPYLMNRPEALRGSRLVGGT